MNDSIWLVRIDAVLAYDGDSGVWGVFSTEEEAEDAVAALKVSGAKYKDYYAEEWSFSQSRADVEEIKARRCK